MDSNDRHPGYDVFGGVATEAELPLLLSDMINDLQSHGLYKMTCLEMSVVRTFGAMCGVN